MRLEKEGLVNRVPYKGTYVSDINNQDMANIFRIRIVLEGLAIHLATNVLSEADFQKMQELIGDHAEALKRGDVKGVSRINTEFHNIIVNCCSNPRLQQMLHNLDDHLKRYRLLSISQGGRSEKSVPEHQAILDALRTRDPKRAEEAMQLHLTSAMQDLYDQDFEELEQKLHLNP
jgi:DNA-binding GntR family transcriptional regulator